MKRLLLAAVLMFQTNPYSNPDAVVVNAKSHIYHYHCAHVQSCTSCKPIASVEQAVKEGYRACAFIKKEQPK